MTEEEIIVPIQRMFPNCEKYKKCCTDSGTEEMMKKVKEIPNLKEMIEGMLNDIKR